MRLNDALWVLVIGAMFELLILIFIVLFVIAARIWVVKSFSHCINRIKEIEKELGEVKKTSINITHIKETLSEVEKLLKSKK